MLRNELGGQENSDNQHDFAPDAGSVTGAGTNSEIGVTPERQQASGRMSPIGGLPAVALPINEIGAVAKSPRRRRANARLTTNVRLPAVADFGTGANTELDAKAALPSSPIPSDGHSYAETQKVDAVSQPVASVPPVLISELYELYRRRKHAIQTISKLNRSTESFVARLLGYRSPGEKADSDSPEAKKAKKIYKVAADIMKAVETESDTSKISNQGLAEVGERIQHALDNSRAVIEANKVSRQIWNKMHKDTEAEIKELAKQLPVHRWQKFVKGFGELSLGILIGITGDLSGYATKERVWKRLGLAVIDGQRQQKRTDAEAAKAHGYSPQNRAEVWVVADTMFRHQWAGNKDEHGKGAAKSGEPISAPSHPIGPYGVVYGRRKALTSQYEDWHGLRSERDARRIMSKALIEDLWREWNGKPALHVMPSDQ